MTRRSVRSRCLAAASTALLVAGVLTGVALSAGPAGASTLRVSPHGSVLVHARGNGHGHGMSQYGARGAAEAGLSYRKILAFYYRHAKLSTARRTIRVQLSGYGSTTTVSAHPALTVTGVRGSLSTRAHRYRLVSGAGSTVTLQRLARGAHSKWRNYRTGLPDQAAFHAVHWQPIQLLAPNGNSAYFYGRLRAVRAGNHVFTVNRLNLDRYTAGVVPSEMPSSWQRAAVDAQAVAARTYGLYAVEHPRASSYDICDTTSCQVYGGHLRHDRYGNLTGGDFLPAAQDTSGQVLTYRGQAIFAQFSASNGGWETDGGQPYLVSQRDPYDTPRSGDPYVGFTRTVRVGSIASWFGLTRLTRVTVTGRDGNGQWGGRVGGVVLTGTDSSGHAKRISTDGYQLGAALGLGTTWFTVTKP